MNANEMIERYVHEVGQHLPRKLRADIQLELDSLLHDALEEQAEKSGREADEEMAVALLQDFGKPEDIAQQYGPKKYLIGPALYPAFQLTLFIAFGLVAFGFVTSLVFASPFEASNQNFLATVGEIVLRYGEALLVNLGLVVAVFAGLQFFGIGQNTATNAETWDPRSLPEVKDVDRISRTDLIGSLLWRAFFVVSLNFFPNWFAIYFNTSNSDGFRTIPLLAAEFQVHVPWITVLLLAEAVLYLIVSRNGRWTQPTRWAEFIITLFGLYVIWRIISGGPISTISIVTTLTRYGLSFMLLIGSIEAISQLYRLIAKQPLTSWQTLKSRLALD